MHSMLQLKTLFASFKEKPDCSYISPPAFLFCYSLAFSEVSVRTTILRSSKHFWTSSANLSELAILLVFHVVTTISMLNQNVINNWLIKWLSGVLCHISSISSIQYLWITGCFFFKWCVVVMKHWKFGQNYYF